MTDQEGSATSARDKWRSRIQGFCDRVVDQADELLADIETVAGTVDLDDLRTRASSTFDNVKAKVESAVDRARAYGQTHGGNCYKLQPFDSSDHKCKALFRLRVDEQKQHLLVERIKSCSHAIQDVEFDNRGVLRIKLHAGFDPSSLDGLITGAIEQVTDAKRIPWVCTFDPTPDADDTSEPAGDSTPSPADRKASPKAKLKADADITKPAVAKKRVVAKKAATKATAARKKASPKGGNAPKS